MDPSRSITEHDFRRADHTPPVVDPKIHAAVEKWAADDLRSVNAQIEYLLRQALKQSKRTP